MKTGRPKGTHVKTCRCGWRVAGKGKSKTCAACGSRVVFDRERTRPPRKKAT